MIFGEKSSDRPETALACPGDPLDSIGPTSTRIWQISEFSEIQRRRFVVAIFCALPGWSPFSVPSSLLKAAAVAVVVVVTSSLSRIAAVAVVVLTAHRDVTANLEQRVSHVPGFFLLKNVTSGEVCQIVLVLVAHTLWALLSLSRGSPLEFGHCRIPVLSGKTIRLDSHLLISSFHILRLSKKGRWITAILSPLVLVIVLGC